MGHWHVDFEAEQTMKSIGMKFKYVENYALRLIKAKDSKQLNARFDASTDEEMVQQYANQMKSNIAFPAIVVEEKTGRVLGGVHRYSASVICGWEIISVYLVTEATQAQIDDFIRRDNCRHGKNLTEKEKIATCVELHKKYGHPVTWLNEKYFAKNPQTYEKIVLAIQAATVEDKLVELHVPVLNSMTRSTLTAMHPIVNNTNVLKEVGKLVHEYDLPINRVQEVVKEIRRCSTEATQLQSIQEKRQELYIESKKGVVAIPKPEKDLYKTVRNFKHFLETGFSGKPFPPVDKFVLDSAQQKEICESITTICNLLKSLKRKTR